jgi:hypothetical protein
VPILRQRRDDALDRLGEAHVEHLVGLIQHQRLKLRQVAEALVDQVQQPPRRGHDDVDTGLERIDLVELADAAEDRRHAGPQMAAEALEAVGDLGDQFARGRQDQDAGTALGRRARIRARRCSSGSAKAAVLPVPVWAMPSRSRPSSSIGIDWAWIGVGVAYPSSASARSRVGARERSAKVMDMVKRRLRRSVRLRRRASLVRKAGFYG